MSDMPLLLLLFGAAAPQQVASPPSVVDLYLTPISAEQLQRFAKILVELDASRVSPSGPPAPKAQQARKDAVILRNGMSPEMFRRIRAQIRYDRGMARRVAESINILRSATPGA